MTVRRPTPVALVVAGTVTSLAACTGPTSSATPISAAPRAGDPACVRALESAPTTVAGLARTPLAVQGALSWGEPGVVLRCGLPDAAPTTDPCLGVNGVDWTVDTSSDPYIFVSYGRSPAVELRVPARYGNDSAVAAVTDVGPIAAALPTNGRACIGADDVVTPTASS